MGSASGSLQLFFGSKVEKRKHENLRSYFGPYSGNDIRQRYGSSSLSEPSPLGRMHRNKGIRFLAGRLRPRRSTSRVQHRKAPKHPSTSFQRDLRYSILLESLRNFGQCLPKEQSNPKKNRLSCILKKYSSNKFIQ